VCYVHCVRAVLFALLVAACTAPNQGAVATAPGAAVAGARVRALRPPRAVDPDAPGAMYLAAVAARVQPGWAQFLDDCRLRLPVEHPLNQLALAATAELAIEPTGGVSGLDLATSGNADFDRAAQQALIEAAPLPAPPPALLSDDDRVHLRWLFARDDRQAGPATAQLVHVELPLADVVDHRLARGDLALAARRIAAASDDDPAIEAAANRLVIATLREALASADDAVRRAAVDAIARARAGELARDVRALLADTNGVELRVVAITAAGALGDGAAAAELARDLAADLPAHPRLAIAEARALAALGQAAAVTAAVRAVLPATGAPPAVAVELLAVAPAADLAPRLIGWLAHGDARTRAAACTALAGGVAAWPAIARGLDDGDAVVRAACVDAAIAHAAAAPPPAVVARLHDVVRDRDIVVRARGVAAVLAIDPAHAVRAATDPAAAVRAAYATALATAPHAIAARGDLDDLAGDRDADVRAAALAALAGRDELVPGVAARAATDPSAAVRIAAMPRLVDDAALARLAADADPGVATAAAIRQVAVHGRAASTRALVERIAAAPAGSAERVRAAVAWLLAG
jgi:hypothetical protein